MKRAFLACIALVLAVLHVAVSAATPAVSAGGTHSLAIHTDGTIRSWGADDSGQLGLGRALNRTSPAAVAGVSGIRSVVAGDEHVIALKADGTLLAWGRNREGQLGDGSTVNRSLPVAVTGLTGVESVSTRGGHAVAVKPDGSVWAWGGNGSAELGDGGYEGRTVPARITGIDNVRAVAAGSRYTLALKRDGSVWAWGNNDHGQLGDGTRTELYVGRPAIAPVTGLSGVQKIAAGGSRSLALKADGTVWAWGEGATGDGTAGDKLLPVQVAGLTGVKDIAAGYFSSLAVKNDGSVWTWGGDVLAPTQIAGLGNVNTVAPGLLHTMALLADGSLVAFGYNDAGQLGDGTTIGRSTPAPVPGLAGVAAISAGAYFSIALKADGSIATWGDNNAGQLGSGSILYRTTPSVVNFAGASAVATGFAHSLALKSDGTVWSWGSNGNGELGDPQRQNRALPGAVSGLGVSRSAVAIAAGVLHSLALKSDDSVVAWGYNFSSALGDGTNERRETPVPVIGLPPIMAIAAGAEHSLALARDQNVWAWGSNGNGQVGDGTRVNRATPTRVTGIGSVSAIAAGNDHTLALKTDGSVWAWGANRYGQLGDGTTSDRATPAQVVGLAGVTVISAGGNRNYAQESDGSVWTWGDETLLPVQVTELSGTPVLAPGRSHTLAIKADGSVYGWGQNEYGRVGDGTLADRGKPVVVVREGGAGSVAGNNWFLDLKPSITKVIPAEKQPVFLTVATQSGNDVVANLQYRAADIGSTGSVFVFALAPANKVANVSAEMLRNAKGPVVKGRNTADTPLPCVLAQLTASGQLTAVTAGTLQAYLTGVLSAQGASVSVLNGVSTALLSGSVFYVGYGSNGTAAVNNGTNRSVVTIPGSTGSQTCTPQAPQTGWWWNPNEDGRGFGIEVRGNNLFMSGYLYDDSGHATWVVSPGPVALDGSFYNGTLYQVANGQTLTGTYKAPSPPTTPGNITLSFTDARHGTLIWPGGAIPIVRFDDVIGSGGGTTPSFVPENGWWWNADESGRGYFLELKNNYAFIAGYMYETDGRPVWYLTQNPMTTPQTFSGSWLQVQGGQTLTGPYKKPTVLNANVGSVGIVFQDASNATLTLPNGRQVAITRQRF